MTDTNPEIEKQLDALAELCCQTLQGDRTGMDERSEALLKALLMSGYVRKTGKDLRADVEARAKKSCPQPAMHRGGALSGITRQLQHHFDKIIRWESERPAEKSPPKGANISSSTDA